MIQVNKRAMPRVSELIEDADALKVKVHQIAGSTVIDAGVEATGSYHAAKLITEILQGCTNDVSYSIFPERIGNMYFDAVHVHSTHVVIEQAGCNISGWELRPGKFAPVLAGPGRCVARKDGDWLSSYCDYSDDSDIAILTVEQGQMMSEEDVKDLQEATGVAKEKLFIIVAASGSIVCSVQVAGRILEQTLHRLKEESFPLESIQEAHGFCVIPPVVKDDLLAMGRLNDVLLYGGQSTFTVDTEDSEIEKVINKITSDKSAVYGEMFEEIYARHGYDFYQVPMDIYSPAKVAIINQRTGRTFQAGEFNIPILKKSFFTGK